MKVYVIGTGTMGAGVVQAFAQANMPVVMKSRTQASLDKAVGKISKSLAKLVGPSYAKELIYTGKLIDAQEAHRNGLVSVYEQADLMEEAMKLVKMILKNAPIAVAYAKKCINDNYDMNIDEALAYENEYFAKCFSTEDQKDGMTAFLAKEKAVFKGK